MKINWLEKVRNGSTVASRLPNPKVVMESVPAILPWDVLEVLRRQGDKVLTETLGGPIQRRFKSLYWSNAVKLGWANNHPIFTVDPRDFESIFVNRMFADEATTYNSQGQDACYFR